MAQDMRGRVPPSVATAVTFFRLQATTEQMRRFAEGAEGVIFRQSGASIVVWAELDGISFDQLRGNQLQRVGLCAHLQKLNATGVLLALERALHVYLRRCLRGHKHKATRRKNKPRFASAQQREKKTHRRPGRHRFWPAASSDAAAAEYRGHSGALPRRTGELQCSSSSPATAPRRSRG